MIRADGEGKEWQRWRGAGYELQAGQDTGRETFDELSSCTSCRWRAALIKRGRGGEGRTLLRKGKKWHSVGKSASEGLPSAAVHFRNPNSPVPNLTIGGQPSPRPPHPSPGRCLESLRFLLGTKKRDRSVPLDWLFWSGKRDSNPRPQPWQGCALPAELFPLESVYYVERSGVSRVMEAGLPVRGRTVFTA